MWYVNVYETNKAYGGPEEGGWWYEVGEPVSNHPHLLPCYGPFYSQEGAEMALRHLNRVVANANTLEKKRHPDSVLCDGYYQVMMEQSPPAAYPKERPYYE